MDGINKAAKRRRLTDKNIPNAVLQNPSYAEDSKMYQDLLEMERKLDWTITRKRVEIQDTLARPLSTTRTLRIFLSHTVANQVWQTGGEETADPETGEGIPSWSLKIEGRLLESPSQRKDKGPPRKFSTFIKRMTVELDRDNSLYPDGNIVEWPRSTGPDNPVLDGFTLRRTGDAPTRARIILFLEHFPEQFKVSPELGNILGIKEESRIGVVQALWSYIKLQNLQDKADRRMVHADEKLATIVGPQPLPFQKLPELVNRHLLPPDPIVLYDIDPTMASPERPMAWDVELKMEDTATKNRLNVMVQANRESAASLAKLDEEIALRVQALQNSHLKRTFLQSFAEDPAGFIQTWLESQSRDLDSVLGTGASEGQSLRQDELRRSEFFRMPWVEEAVAVHEGIRLANKM
ncbi:SWI/SNF complex 60 kDa subunit, partial [Cylindrobasidium torrendii FP15055 ss-10]